MCQQETRLRKASQEALSEGSQGRMVSAESGVSWASQNMRRLVRPGAWWGMIHAVGQSEEPGLSEQQVHFFHRTPSHEWGSFVHSVLIHAGWSLSSWDGPGRC